MGDVAVDDLLERAVDGHGAVVGVVGPPGIGKSRLVREVAALARRRGVEVFTTFCESHTSQVPFHAVARLVRAATGVEGLDGQIARDRVRDRVPDADPEDLALFDDLLGIADPNTPYPRSIPMPVGGGWSRWSTARRWPTKLRRSMSSRTPIGSMSSASRCWPTSLR